jgi:hypothetical protein
MNCITAWTSENHELEKDMINGALCKKPGWKKLEYSSHFTYLNELILMTNEKSICDIGCGAGELGRVYKDYHYEGYDLQHIVENVSKVVNPQLTYNYFDANNFNYNLFKKYDLLICNGFISELINPLEIIKNLLENTNKYLIIHRQKIGNKTEIINYKTYADLLTSQSIVGIEDLKQILKFTNTRVVKQCMFDGLVSLLITK